MTDHGLIKVTRNGQVTLPSTVRNRLKVEEGDYMAVRVTEDSIILTPKILIDKSQAYFWTSEWQAAEREASGDIADGRIEEFENVEDLLSSLKEARSSSQQRE
jgi:AbrB family looped-hinge helix DNA binding protein